MTKAAELLPGTLDLLILKAVSLGKLHGYSVRLRIEQISDGLLHIQQRALYPALYRVEQQGLIASDCVDASGYGKKKGLRGRFAMYVPPLMAAMPYSPSMRALLSPAALI